MKPIRAGIAIVFLVIGIFLIKFALTQPCEAGEFGISTEAGGLSGLPEGFEEIEENIEMDMPSISINIPAPIQRLMCMFTSWMSLVAILIGISFTWGGARGLVMNSVYLRREKKKKH